MKKELQWKLHRVADGDTSLLMYRSAERITEIVRSAFDGSTYQPSLEIQALLATSDYVGLLESADGGICGIASLSLPQARLTGKQFIWVNKVAIIPEHWGFGWGTDLLHRAIVTYFSDQSLAYLGCLTQNPALLKGFSNLGQLTFPLTHWYSQSDGLRIVSYLHCEVEQFRQCIASTTDRDVAIDSIHGIIHGRYTASIIPPRKGPLSKEVRSYLRRMKRVGFKPENGDALVLVTKLI